MRWGAPRVARAASRWLALLLLFAGAPEPPSGIGVADEAADVLRGRPAGPVAAGSGPSAATTIAAVEPGRAGRTRWLLRIGRTAPGDRSALAHSGSLWSGTRAIRAGPSRSPTVRATQRLAAACPDRGDDVAHARRDRGADRGRSARNRTESPARPRAPRRRCRCRGGVDVDRRRQRDLGPARGEALEVVERVVEHGTWAGDDSLVQNADRFVAVAAIWGPMPSTRLASLRRPGCAPRRRSVRCEERLDWS